MMWSLCWLCGSTNITTWPTACCLHLAPLASPVAEGVAAAATLLQEGAPGAPPRRAAQHVAHTFLQGNASNLQQTESTHSKSSVLRHKADEPAVDQPAVWNGTPPPPGCAVPHPAPGFWDDTPPGHVADAAYFTGTPCPRQLQE
jgi:hypothetical protein